MNTQVHLFILSIIVALGGYFGYSEIKKIKGKLLSLEKEKEKDKETNSKNYNVPVNHLSNNNNITNLDELEQSNHNNLDLEYDNLDVKTPNMYNITTYYDKYGDSINYTREENNETAISNNHLEESQSLNSILDDEVSGDSASSDSQVEESIIDNILLDKDSNNNQLVDTNLLEEKNINDISLESDSNTNTIVDTTSIVDTNTVIDTNLVETNMDEKILDNDTINNPVVETNINGEELLETNIDDNLLNNNSNEYQIPENELDMEEDDSLNQLEHKIEKHIEYSMEEKTIVENYLEQTQENDKEDLKKLYSKYSVKQLKEEFIKIGQSVPKGKKEILVDELINLTIK